MSEKYLCALLIWRNKPFSCGNKTLTRPVLLGEIHGTLHREVWELFAAELVVGAVLVIRNVGLLSTGISSRRHYLNITANNLVTIYSASSGNSALFKTIIRLGLGLFQNVVRLIG